MRFRYILFVILAFVGSVNVLAQASADEKAALMEKVLRSYNSSGIDSYELAMLFHNNLMANLAKIGTEDESREVLWKILNDDKKTTLWGAAMDMTQHLGIPQDEVMKWARPKLETIAMLNSRTAHFWLERVFFQFGTPEDAERLIKLAYSLDSSQEQQATLIRSTARFIMGKFERHPLSEQGTATKPDKSGNSKSNQTRSKDITGPVSTLEPPKSPIKSQSSAPSAEYEETPRGWLLWLLVVIAATVGAAWLLLRKWR